MLKKFRNLNIRIKIALLLNGLALITIALVSVMLTQQFKQALQERILLQLSSIRHLKTMQIENLLKNYIHEINTMLIHIDDETYLDALANDQFIHIDSIVINHELMELRPEILDSIEINDISSIIHDGRIHLAFHIPNNQLIYTFYSSPSAIQNVLFERTGMGETGETYIIGEDGYMRSQSRFWIDSIPTLIKSKTTAFHKAQKQREGFIKHLDYRNIPVFSSFAVFNFKGINWIILSEIDVEEALLPLKAMEKRIYAITALIAIGILLISTLIAWFIVNPVLKIKEALTHISLGERTTLPIYHSKDEIGDLYTTLESFLSTLDQIIDFANHIANGELNQTMIMRGPNDRLVRSLNNMRDQLVEIKDREKLLQAKSQKLLMAGEEKERGRLSKELHDSIGPLLTNLKLLVSREDINNELLIRRVQLIIEEVRKISVNLMPSVLKDFGLVAAIQSFLDQLPKSSTCEISFSFNSENETSSIPLDLALNAFRIVQETVNNTLKHANATIIKLSVTEFVNQVNIFIADNGIGFDINQVTLGNGLMNIKERVKLFNGHIDVQSDNEGTRFEIEFEFE